MLVVPRDGQTAITKKENSAQVMSAESLLSCNTVGLNFEGFLFWLKVGITCEVVKC